MVDFGDQTILDTNIAAIVRQPSTTMPPRITRSNKAMPAPVSLYTDISPGQPWNDANAIILSSSEEAIDALHQSAALISGIASVGLAVLNRRSTCPGGLTFT